MARKLGPPIFLGVFTILALLLLTGTFDDEDVLRETFQIDAVYDAGNIKVTFFDSSEKTSLVVMEILGMSESFQKTFAAFEFTETIPFPNEPKHGWKVHPVVLEIDHEEFGHIQLKTEIYNIGDSTPPVIYSTP